MASDMGDTGVCDEDADCADGPCIDQDCECSAWDVYFPPSTHNLYLIAPRPNGGILGVGPVFAGAEASDGQRLTRYAPGGEAEWTEVFAPSAEHSSLGTLAEMGTHILAEGSAVLDGVGHTGFVTRLDENAEPVWMTTFENRPEDQVQTAGLAFDGKGGVAVGLAGDLVKLDATTGEPVWEVDPGETVLEVLEVHSLANGDFVALATADDSSGCGRAVVFAVSADGQQLWSRELPANDLFLRLAGHERGVVVARLEQPPSAHCGDLHGEGVVIAVDSIDDTGAVEWTVHLEPRQGFSWYPWYGDVALGGSGEVLLSLGETSLAAFEQSLFEVDETGVIAQTQVGEGRQLETSPDDGVYFLTQTGRTIGRWCPQ